MGPTKLVEKALGFALLVLSGCGMPGPSLINSIEKPLTAERAATKPAKDFGPGGFYFHGANQYYFFYKDHRMTDDVMADAKTLGLNVLRTWAFCEGGMHDGFCFQPKAREYHEPSFVNLDYTIYKAGQMGIKLILTLANNWGGFEHFGGIDEYLTWSPTARSHDDFYRDKTIKEIYQDYVKYVLNRKNTYTGVAYKDDPTILMWELINEPRADDKKALYDWIDEMAGFIKGIDQLHLVSTGSEGGYASDFIETHRSQHIDVASLHLYPEAWGLSISQAEQYIRDHIQAGKEILGKPVFLGEFGFREQAKRDEIYRRWYEIMDEGNISGALFWLLSGHQYGDPKNEGTLYPDYDGFTVYQPESGKTCDIIAAYSEKINNKRLLPQIDLLSPTASSAVKASVAVKAKITAIDGIQQALLLVDGLNPQPMVKQGDFFTASIDSKPYPDGRHLIQIKATDAGGRSSQSTTLVFFNNTPGNATLYADGKDDVAAPDLGDIYIADDTKNIHLLLHHFGGPAPHFSNNNYIYIDIDNNPATGDAYGFDHRIDFQATTEHPQGYGDIIEWYYWNGKYWGYGKYWQGADSPTVMRGNARAERLPSGQIAFAVDGMMEFSFPKTPALGQGAEAAAQLKLWIGGTYDQVASPAAPIVHQYTSDHPITIDGKVTDVEEWDYKW